MNSMHSKILKTVLVMACAAQVGNAVGSVILTNTRVIYSGSAHEESLQFTNQDDSPSVMQVWVDSGDKESTPETADAPFVVTPPVFRIEPKAGQTARLIFSGADLPTDRESIFYVNTLQIPSMDTSYGNENQMMVFLRNRLKLFYRPAGLEGSAQTAHQKLSVRIEGHGKGERIVVNNPSAYHVSLLDGSVTCGKEVATFSAGMVAPRSEAAWNLKGNCPASVQPHHVNARYVNDYGAIGDAEFTATVEAKVK